MNECWDCEVEHDPDEIPEAIAREVSVFGAWSGRCLGCVNDRIEAAEGEVLSVRRVS